MSREAISERATRRVSLTDPGSLALAVTILRGGDVIAFPTDTVYGAGSHAFLHEAVGRLYWAKQRPVSEPVPLLIPDAAWLGSVCEGVPPVAWALAERFWPGGLTLVLRRSTAVPDIVVAGGATVAVRVPDYRPIVELCDRLGAPLAASSANLHGMPSPVTATEVESQLRGRIPLILDGGSCPGGLASTVLDLTTVPAAIVRHGPIPADQLSSWVSLRSD